MSSFVTKFADILRELKLLSEQQAADLKKEFYNRSKEVVIDFLLFEAAVDKGELLKALSIYYNLPSFNVAGYLFDHRLVSSFPTDFLRSSAIIPLAEENDIVTIVAADPDISGLTSRIEEYTDAVVQYNVGLKRDIWDAIQEFSQEAVTEENFEGLDQEREDLLEEDEKEEIVDTHDYY